MKYVKPIDPHVHLRGEEYAGLDYMRHGFEDAKKVGLCAILEMPNPVPQLTNPEVIDARIEVADTLRGDILHGINAGLTNDLDQVRHIAQVAHTNGRITALKIFFTHSTGNMGILDEDVQREIWRTLADVGFIGTVMGHYEDEKAYTGQYDYKDPISHTFFQNAQAELVQVERQLRNAVDAKFCGTLYVCHISNPLTITLLEQEKKKDRKFQIVAECTFHHILLNYIDYIRQGNRVKMNPPIRSRDRQEALLEAVLAGKIDVIGTDHAPHPVEKKDSDKPPSGIPALLFWPQGIRILQKAGINEKLLEDITFNNANRIFRLELDKQYFEYSGIADWSAYGYNPFERVCVSDL